MKNCDPQITPKLCTVIRTGKTLLHTVQIHGIRDFVAADLVLP